MFIFTDTNIKYILMSTRIVFRYDKIEFYETTLNEILF
jgi:hypothetical protein